MKFTLDTEAKTIELLQGVTIKELIGLRNIIADFDSYYIKGKIVEVTTGIQKAKDDELTKKIVQRGIEAAERLRKIKEQDEKYPNMIRKNLRQVILNEEGNLLIANPFNEKIVYNGGPDGGTIRYFAAETPDPHM